MALTRLDSQMIEVPASITDLTVTNLQSPALNNVGLWDITYSIVLNNQDNWNFGYESATIVQANSSTWGGQIAPELTNLLTTVTVNSANWEFAYTTVSNISNALVLSGDIIPTVTDYLSTNHVEISSIHTSHLTLSSTTTPSVSTDNGVKGSIKWDFDYLYICVEENVWKRVALSDW